MRCSANPAARSSRPGYAWPQLSSLFALVGFPEKHPNLDQKPDQLPDISAAQAIALLQRLKV
jgi:hypothetical protein